MGGGPGLDSGLLLSPLTRTSKRPLDNFLFGFQPEGPVKVLDCLTGRLSVACPFNSGGAACAIRTAPRWGPPQHSPHVMRRLGWRKMHILIARCSAMLIDGSTAAYSGYWGTPSTHAERWIDQ